MSQKKFFPDSLSNLIGGGVQNEQFYAACNNQPEGGYKSVRSLFFYFSITMKRSENGAAETF